MLTSVHANIELSLCVYATKCHGGWSGSDGSEVDAEENDETNVHDGAKDIGKDVEATSNIPTATGSFVVTTPVLVLSLREGRGGDGSHCS